MFGAVPLCHGPAVPREHWDHSLGGNCAGDRPCPAVGSSGQRCFPPISHTGIKRSTEYFPEQDPLILEFIKVFVDSGKELVKTFLPALLGVA